MAERRMFAKTIIDSDAFLEMPISARLLYYDLSMRADDDGFNNSPKKVMRTIGASTDDMNILIARKFVLPFESGVVVIKHWKIHNYIRKDTYKETTYKEEKSLLEFDENNAYRIANAPRQLYVDAPSTQVRIGKDSIGKLSIEEDREEKESKETYVSLIDSYTTNPQLVSILKDYVEMRKKMKGFTTRALKLNLDKLTELAKDDDTKIAIVEQSIEHSWKTFYALKVQTKTKEIIPEWTKQEQETTKDEHLEELKRRYMLLKLSNNKTEMDKIKDLYFDLTLKDIETEI